MSQSNGTTTKKELVNRIAGELGEKKVLVKEVIQRFLDSIIDELAAGHRLEFREFGVFEVRERAARMAQNPRTLDKVQVPAKRVVKFKVGRRMRQLVCEGEVQPTAASSTPSEAPANQNPSSGFKASTPPNLNPDSKFG
jgi:integration host factor subunit beta